MYQQPLSTKPRVSHLCGESSTTVKRTHMAWFAILSLRVVLHTRLTKVAKPLHIIYQECCATFRWSRSWSSPSNVSPQSTHCCRIAFLIGALLGEIISCNLISDIPHLTFLTSDIGHHMYHENSSQNAPACSLVSSECLNALPASTFADGTREPLFTGIVLSLGFFSLSCVLLLVKGSMQAMVHVHKPRDARHRVHGHLHNIHVIQRKFFWWVKTCNFLNFKPCFT